MWKPLWYNWSAKDANIVSCMLILSGYTSMQCLRTRLSSNDQVGELISSPFCQRKLLLLVNVGCSCGGALFVKFLCTLCGIGLPTETFLVIKKCNKTHLQMPLSNFTCKCWEENRGLRRQFILGLKRSQKR